MADTLQLLLTDVPEAHNKAGDFEPWAKVYTNWEMLDFGRQCRATALASRPAEVDDEGLPALPKCVAYGFVGLGGLAPGDPHKQLIGVSVQPGGTHMQKVQIPLFTAEQYRQGQRDAVAADRARMDWTEISDAITEAYNLAFAHKDWQATDYWRDLGKRFSAWAAPSHTTNKDET